MSDTWRSIAARKVEERRQRIPKEWLIDSSLRERNNVLSVPRECGILTDDELRITERYDATALLAGLATGLLNSVDVTLAFCKRSAIAQQCCNCLTEIFYDDALRRARELDDYFAKTGKTVGPLHGLPISLKDCFKVKGFDSCVGYAALCFQPATKNSALVDLLISLGAVLYCKTNIPQAMSSLDSNNNVFGRTLNPRARKLTAGGSSGGEGALIAMRGSIIGVGTDVGGSIRVPASCNHIYGVKPSHGRVPYAGLESGSPAGTAEIGLHATAGPLATTMRDCEMLLQVISDSLPSAFDSEVFEQDWAHQHGLTCLQDGNIIRPLRVGVVRTDGHVTPLPPMQRLMDEIVKTLSDSSGYVELVEVDISALAPLSLKSFNGLLGIDGGNNYLDLLAKTGEPLSPWHATRIRRGRWRSAEQVRELKAQRTQLQSDFLKVWQDRGLGDRPLDVLICPNAPHPTAPIDRWNTTNYTSLFNMLDYPCGVLPVRLFGENDVHGDVLEKALNNWDKVNQQLWTTGDKRDFLGAPMNIQVVAPRLMERRLLEAMTILDELLQPLRTNDGRPSKL